MGWLVGPWWAEPTAVPAASDSDHWKSTASTWPLWTLPPECLRPPRAGWWRCWSGWILQTGPLSGVAHFCSWCSGSEASTCYKQPLSHWLVPQKAPPPSPRLPCATVNQRPLGVLLSHWSVPQRAPPPTLVFKRNLSLDWGKTVFWEASLPSSQFASFPSKVIILCLNNSSADLLASPVASKMNLGSVHLEILMKVKSTRGHWTRYYSEHGGLSTNRHPQWYSVLILAFHLLLRVIQNYTFIYNYW